MIQIQLCRDITTEQCIIVFPGTKLEPRRFALGKKGSQGEAIEIEKEFENAATVSLTEEEYKNLIFVANTDGCLTWKPTAEIEMTDENGSTTKFTFKEVQTKQNGKSGVCKLHACLL